MKTKTTINLLEDESRRRFRQRLLRWYDRNHRKLPWRGETDPYRILLSEVMLQQTRVAVVEERYRLFLAQFPTLEHLAFAHEDSVLSAWSGLGYYRRARSLHAAAKTISETKFFPRSSVELQQLPGVGRYTAAAVASIAFGETVAVVDGNVRRVIGRIVGKEATVAQNWETAQALLHPGRPGDFNQAMMELGATVCLPANPVCGQCPIIDFCESRGASPRKAQQARKKATLAYLFSQRGDSVYLRRRIQTASLMPGMWELPEFRSSHRIKGKPLLQLRHSITNTDYRVVVFQDSTSFLGHKNSIGGGKWIALSSAKKLPLTGLTNKILRNLDL